MIAFNEILCPVDLSPVSRHAFGHATALAARYGARLHVLHVYTVLIPATVPPFALAGPAGTGEEPEPDLSEIHGELAKLIAPARAAGVDVELAVVDGIPAHRIGERARSLGADLIVMGTHGHSRLERFLLGSVTERVVRTNTMPILTVPPSCDDQPSAHFSNILCCIDFAEHSYSALSFGLSLAAEAQGRITLLHVVDWPEQGEPLTSLPFAVPEYRLERQLDAERRLQALLPEDTRRLCRPTTIVKAGRPSHAILEAARDISADLIVIGSHGHNALEHLFVGSTANHVIRGAACPVLTMGRT